MKTSQVTQVARGWAGKAAQFAVASGLAETALRRGLRMRRKMLRKSRPNIAKRMARGLLLAAAVAGVAFIGPKLMRRTASMEEMNLSELNPHPTP